MVPEKEDKNSEILNHLIKKEITIESIIYHLRNNRLKYTDEFRQDKTENSKVITFFSIYFLNI